MLIQQRENQKDNADPKGKSLNTKEIHTNEHDNDLSKAVADSNNIVDNNLEEPKPLHESHEESSQLKLKSQQSIEKPQTSSTFEPKDFKGPTNDRQRAVVNAFKHAWGGYKEFSWGHDNLKPISMGSMDWFGLGLTIVDALDTIYIMDLQEGWCNVNLNMF